MAGHDPEKCGFLQKLVLEGQAETRMSSHRIFGRLAAEKRLFRRDATLTPRGALPHGAFHERFPRHLHHLRDYELAIAG
jgi:hypothetical protein